MSNEELVKLIQEGERDNLPILWEQVERFVHQQAGRHYRKIGSSGGVDEQDLYQSGFLALIEAVESYDTDKGMSFAGWLPYHLKTAFAEVTGYRTERQRRDPIHRAGSLDAPLTGEDDATLAEILADPTDQHEATEERIYREQLNAKLRSYLATLPEEESSTLSRRYFHNQTLRQIAEGTADQRGASSVVTTLYNTVPTRREHDVLCHSGNTD